MTAGSGRRPHRAARAQYLRRIGQANVDLFVDLFNLSDAQSTIQRNDLVAGLGAVAFNDSVSWVLPRRAFVGARVRF